MAFQNRGWPCKQELKAAGKVGSKVSSSERNSFCCGQDSKSCLSGLCKQEVINVIEIHSMKTGECALTSPAAQKTPSSNIFQYKHVTQPQVVHGLTSSALCLHQAKAGLDLWYSRYPYRARPYQTTLCAGREDTRVFSACDKLGCDGRIPLILLLLLWPSPLGSLGLSQHASLVGAFPHLVFFFPFSLLSVFVSKLFTQHGQKLQLPRNHTSMCLRNSGAASVGHLNASLHKARCQNPPALGTEQLASPRIPAAGSL